MPDDMSFEPIVSAPVETPAPRKAGLARKRKLLLLGLTGLVAATAAAVGGYWMAEGAHYVATDNAYVGASTAQVTSQVGGRILEVRVADTEAVQKGDILALIDPTDAALSVAKAEADYRTTLQRVRQYYAQADVQAAQVGARQADVERASQDYGRRQALADSGAISQEELTATRSALNAARANLTAARQSLAASRSLTQDSLDRHPEVAAARAALDAARLSLERTVIRASVDGIVAQKTIQVGQRIEVGQPLMVVAPVGQAYVDANFKEGQLGRVRPGQPVELISDMYGEEVVFHGRVTGLGGGTGSAFAVIPAQNATGNWIKVVQRVPVRVQLDPRELARHPLRVGLSMEAKIDTRSIAAG